MRRDRKVDKKPYRAPSLVALDLGRRQSITESQGASQGSYRPGETISLSYKNNKTRFRVTWVGDTETDKGTKRVKLVCRASVK